MIFRINEAFINVYENNLFDLGLMDLAIILIVYLGLTLFVSRGGEAYSRIGSFQKITTKRDHLRNRQIL